MRQQLKKASLFAIIYLFSIHISFGQVNATQAVLPSNNIAYSKDVSSESSIITALYEVISGESGEVRDWARFKNLFGKDALFEKELKHELVSFGTIAHVFSTYETRESKNGPITNRGINSIQLFYDQNRYYIVNVFWCAESMGFALPAASLQ